MLGVKCKVKMPFKDEEGEEAADAMWSLPPELRAHVHSFVPEFWLRMTCKRLYEKHHAAFARHVRAVRDKRDLDAHIVGLIRADSAFVFAHWLRERASAWRAPCRQVFKENVCFNYLEVLNMRCIEWEASRCRALLPAFKKGKGQRGGQRGNGNSLASNKRI